MKKIVNSTPFEVYGATAIISHRVLKGEETKYESWLEKIAPLCKKATGHLDWQMIQPIPNLTTTYTIIIRFDSETNLNLWMNSVDRDQLINEISLILDNGDQYSTRTGLEFLFSFENQITKPPLRWKQFLVTWSAIFPLVCPRALPGVPMSAKIVTEFQIT
ncbi:antibiotic biosynthesis monooxygenase [Leptospira brenneri]|uniref:antibiotic biosynthesis monooxygenase n=1 Tax=Leptospira brenneri TaxID=2023182 RepID=UPI001AD817A7|nr:antibiotic biosynthesis monooxygenase [Leptospira brenneri]